MAIFLSIYISHKIISIAFLHPFNQTEDAIMKQTILCLRFDQKLTPVHATLLRGAFADKYAHTLLHHHDGEKFIYQTPLIQYKILFARAFLVGMNEGGELLQKIAFDADEFRLRGQTVKVLERSVQTYEVPFGIAKYPKTYHFLTPWLALNEENYQHYVCYTTEKQLLLLKRILIGNLLALAKGFGHTISEEIQVASLKVKPQNVRLKGTPMVGFSGDFSVNFHIPELWGIGKSSSRGFGTVLNVTNI